MSIELKPEGFAEKVKALRDNADGVKTSFSWLGLRRTLTLTQAESIAQTFGASRKQLSASKTIINTRNQYYKKLTSLRSQARAYLFNMTLPYIEHGVRLLRRSDLEQFVPQMQLHRNNIREAGQEFADHYPEIMDEAHTLLGDLHDEKDYPQSVAELFDLTWDIVSLEPPPYLMQFSPQLYAQECAKVQKKFEATLVTIEEGFALEFHKLVTHLVTRMKPDADGNMQQFKGATVENIKEFCAKFKAMQVNSNEELDKLVSQAQALLEGVNASDLRTDAVIQGKVTEGMDTLLAALAQQPVIQKPRRKITRRKKNEAPVAASEQPVVEVDTLAA